jgi:hypothetical protein
MQFAGVEFCLEDLVHALLALHAALADEFGADDERLEMLAVAVEFEMFAGMPARMSCLICSGCIMGFSL